MNAVNVTFSNKRLSLAFVRCGALPARPSVVVRVKVPKGGTSSPFNGLKSDQRCSTRAFWQQSN